MTRGKIITKRTHKKKKGKSKGDKKNGKIVIPEHGCCFGIGGNY